MTVTATRYHDISTGHRVYGHESKCSHLHGHNYRVHFTVAAKEGDVDSIGRVLDFSVIKKHLCMWLEDNWDHKMLIYVNDPWLHTLCLVDPDGVVPVPFNPTAENMAKYLVEKIGPLLFSNENAVVVSVKIEETMKCSVDYTLDDE